MHCMICHEDHGIATSCGGLATPCGPRCEIPDGRGWGPAAELNELKRRIERLERLLAEKK